MCMLLQWAVSFTTILLQENPVGNHQERMSIKRRRTIIVEKYHIFQGPPTVCMLMAVTNSWTTNLLKILLPPKMSKRRCQILSQALNQKEHTICTDFLWCVTLSGKNRKSSLFCCAYVFMHIPIYYYGNIKILF